MNENLTIGRLASEAGVSVETIRYYQRRGLLKEPAKPMGGHRRYSFAEARRVRFIKRAQQLGFTLDEVTSLLALEDGRSCWETRALAEQKLAVIEQRLDDLSRMQGVLRALVAQCGEGISQRACPIITTLMADA